MPDPDFSEILQPLLDQGAVEILERTATKICLRILKDVSFETEDLHPGDEFTVSWGDDPPACECGSTAVGSPQHSVWCPARSP